MSEHYFTVIDFFFFFVAQVVKFIWETLLIVLNLVLRLCVLRTLGIIPLRSLVVAGMIHS